MKKQPLFHYGRYNIIPLSQETMNKSNRYAPQLPDHIKALTRSHLHPLTTAGVDAFDLGSAAGMVGRATCFYFLIHGCAPGLTRPVNFFNRASHAAARKAVSGACIQSSARDAVAVVSRRTVGPEMVTTFAPSSLYLKAAAPCWAFPALRG